MDAWTQILSGKKTHVLVLSALGFLIAMYQSGQVTGLEAGFFGSLSAAFSTMRFGMDKGGKK